MSSPKGLEGLIANLRAEYERRTSKSRRSHGEARRHLPLGVGSNIRAYEPYPIFIQRARETRLWDLDGNEYLDFSMGFGALMAGHAHPLLVEELRAQLAEGVMHAFPHEYEALMARELKRRFPMDRFRFSNSGAEATSHAVRLARGFTERDLIVKIEGAYHGATDPLLVSWTPDPSLAGPEGDPTPLVSSAGIPEGAWRNTLVAPFNDLAAMERVFKRHGEKVAGVILEPVMLNAGVIPPEEGYLRGVQGLCSEYGAQLILDEVKTGCRLAPGGATEYYGVRPDLIVLGKCIGGGIPLSALGGSEEVMEMIESKKVVHAGTFNTTPLAMRAGLVTLSKILTRPALQGMLKVQGYLERGYREQVEEQGLEAQVQTAGPMGSLLFSPREVRNYRDFARCDKTKWYAYWMGMLTRGVLAHPPGPDEQWNICVQHTLEDVEAHIAALQETLGSLAKVA